MARYTVLLMMMLFQLSQLGFSQCLEGCNTIYQINGENAGDLFGWQAASIGDVDGDQVADFYVSATQHDTGGTNAGRVYVYSGASGSELYRITGKRVNEQFGNDVSAVGDLDGDGVTELIIGAPWNGTGNVSIHSGKTGDFIKELAGEVNGSSFGYRVAGLGDFDGDGLPDYAVTAALFDGLGTDSGRVYIYSKDGLLTTIDGSAAGARFGTSISAIGDVNADGRIDIVVGADNDGPNAQGRAYVYSWDGTKTETLFALDPTASVRDFGQFFVDGGLDMSCDGIPDIYVADFVGNRAYTFSGADGFLLQVFQGDGNGQFGLGEMVEDVNHDGYADLVLAAWVSNSGAAQGGKAFVYSGRDGSLLRSLTHTVRSAQFGFDAKGISDIDGDGLPDLLITAANALGARGTVYLIKGQTYEVPEPELVCKQIPDLPFRWLYPWVSHNSQYDSLVIANNLADEEMWVKFSAQRESGPSWESDVIKIDAHGFLKAKPKQLFPDIEFGSGFALTMFASQQRAAGRWVTNNLNTTTGASPSQAVAIALDGDLLADVGSNLHFGFLPLTDGLVSSPVVVNVGEEPADIQLTFYDRSGQEVADLVLSQVEPLRPFARVAHELVPEMSPNLTMIARSTAPLAGLVFVFNQQSETAIGNASSLGIAQVENELIYAWVSNNQQFESIVIANNVGTDASQVSLTATRADGEQENSGPFEIPPLGFLEMRASELFPTLGEGSGYSVKLTGSGGQLIGRWVTNNLETESGRSPSQAVAINPHQQDRYHGQRIEFGFLPVTDNLTSAPVILNLSESETAVRLRFYDSSGVLVLDDQQTLAALQPFRPFASVANNLVGTEFGDLVLIAESNSVALTGVTFVFNHGSEPAMGNATRVLE